MGRYTGPKMKIVRRLGELPGLTAKKVKKRTKTPGERGKIIFAKTKRSSLADDYKDRLIEKQKLRFNYGVTESQLLAYCKSAKKNKGSGGGALLLQLLESRLDCIVYRLGFAPTIPAARQIVTHGHILVNAKTVSIPSFSCKKGDKISVQKKAKSKLLVTSNFITQQKKRAFLERRFKKSKKFSSRFKILLPSHLEMTRQTFVARILGEVKRQEILVKVKVLKVIEYYSQ